ncbi:hypothetical protein FHU38_001665 [Saccharomonospora amisosensis]|uniref:NifU family protein n=1 Tax=Saccharomonospora amisosensis TaxID=1128677 RepID=A0A7X5ZQB3_9PSEU|nr:hypothetical protein [Saccharomonospora amisosensis]NIJ11321.1 hypothetical protein [Saccharomonospora amisosensis]
MIDPSGLKAMQDMLATDGYRLEATEHGDRVDVRISVADPQACADCLAPEPVLRGILHKQLKVPESAIDLVYPEHEG